MRFPENPINNEIAELVGFQWRRGNYNGCRFLCPPIAPDNEEEFGSCELAIGSETICADYCRHVPDFISDDAAALRLQAHVARLPEVHWIAVSDTPDGELVCEIQYGFSSVSQETHTSLSSAIASACLQCLRDIHTGNLPNPRAPEFHGPPDVWTSSL